MERTLEKYVGIVLMVIILGCTSSKDVTKQKRYSDYEIVNIPLIRGKDTTYINELRFYNTQSALDGIKLMYQNYGRWNNKVEGKYQENIHRFIWQNIKLIDGEDITFMVVADGTETGTDYFTCVMVFDSEGNDCFEDEYPYREELITLFSYKMITIDKSSSVYKLFR